MRYSFGVETFVLQELIGVLFLDIGHEFVLVLLQIPLLERFLRLRWGLPELSRVLLHKSSLQNLFGCRSLLWIFREHPLYELEDLCGELRWDLFDGIVGNFIGERKYIIAFKSMLKSVKRYLQGAKFIQYAA